MKQGAALLLVVILAITTGVLSSTTPKVITSTAGPRPSPTPPPPSPNGSSPPPPPNGSSPPPPPSGSSPPPPPPSPKPSNSSTPPPPPDGSSPAPPPAPWRIETMMQPQEILLQEIRSLDEESTIAQIQKELVKAMNANGNGKKVLPELTDELQKLNPIAKGPVAKDAEGFKEPLGEDLTYNETDDILMNEDSEWDADNDDDDDDDEDDDDDDDEFDDEIDDEEEILFQQNCPIGCRCSDRYVGATTAKCAQFSSEQNFGPDMTHITVENAKDIELGPHALREKGLQQLQSMSIIDTRISSIDKTAFDGIPDLFAVNLTRNGLLGFDPDVFQNNTQLQLLTVSGNPLQLYQGKNSPKYLLDAPTVFDLDLSANALPRLLPTAFTRTPRLVYLNLRNNKIRAVDRATFKPLEQLEELDLSNNQLNGLPADVFDDNKYLEILTISGNNLSTLATIKSSRLNSLDASKNRIRIVAKDDLDGITDLEKLYLRANGLKRIHPHAFIDLLDLTYLDISDNKLAVLEEHHLRTNSRLETLVMNDNPGLETLPVFKSEDGTFSINRFECADCGLVSLSAGTFDAMPAMTRLNLARNQLTKFPKGLLGQLSALRELDLSDNLFRTLDVDMFRGARTLTKLNLAGNPIATLTVQPFLLTPSLSRLDVSRCDLEKIWTDPIMPLPSLRFVSIRGNRIERINVEDLDATPKLSGFDISHNPIACDQEFNAVVQWLVDHGVSPTETLRYMSNYGDADDYSEPEGYGQWTDLAKVICDSVEAGPPPRNAPRRPEGPKVDLPMPRNGLDELARPFDHGISENTDELEDAWLSEDQEYEEYAVVGANYRPWYSGTLWPVMTVILVTLAVVLFVANLAVYLSKRRGRGPVIRAPLILRPGLIDNKNCGLVYKQLQEEIPTPQMAKRGSFYSSSTFHYDKIVPESV